MNNYLRAPIKGVRPLDIKNIDDNFQRLWLKVFGNIDGTNLSSGSVGTTTIADGCVTEPKLADQAVTATKIGAGVITTSHFTAKCVGTNELGDQAVTGAKIKTGEISKSYVGLGNVDNTSDANKPVSTAQQTALNSKANKTQEAWVAPSLLNSWADYGSGYEPSGYMKDDFGFVHLKGIIKTGTPPSIAFTLPVGYRPSNIVRFAINASGAFGSAYIDTSGNVYIESGTATQVSLSGIYFKV
jgi:hypothetical protein